MKKIILIVKIFKKQCYGKEYNRTIYKKEQYIENNKTNNNIKILIKK